MKADDIRAWDEVEIRTRIRELQEERFKLRFQSSMMEMENPSILRQIRRDIARLNTVLRERELAGNGAAETT